MNDHFRRTGTYRTSDIQRVMGDQNQAVVFTSDPTRTLIELADEHLKSRP